MPLWLQKNAHSSKKHRVWDYTSTDDAITFSLSENKKRMRNVFVNFSLLYSAIVNESKSQLEVAHVETTRQVPYIVARKKLLILESDDSEQLAQIHETLQAHLPRQQHRFLIIVNPFGGDKRALTILKEKVRPILDQAQAVYHVMQTDYRQHAKLLCNQLDATVYSAIIVVGGDGLLHECINGLMSRKDRSDPSLLPIGLIPAGTSNAVARSLGISDPVWATVCVLKGACRLQDLVAYEQDGRRLYGHFACMWGIFADIDLGGEAWRCLGRSRLYCSALACLMRLKSYPATISYLSANENVKCQGTRTIDEANKFNFQYRNLFHHDNAQITVIKEYSEFYSFLATKFPWLDRDVRISNKMEPAEPGILHLFVLPRKPQDGARRGHFCKALMGRDSTSLHDDPKLCLHERIRAGRVKFFSPEQKRPGAFEFPILDVDGEELPRSDLYFECMPNMISVFISPGRIHAEELCLLAEKIAASIYTDAASIKFVLSPWHGMFIHTNVGTIQRIIDFGLLQETMNNLVDERTKLVHLRLAEGKVSLPRIMSAIVESLGFSPETIVDVEEIRTLLMHAGMSHIVILISDAFLFPTFILQRLLKILEALGDDESQLSFRLVMDDVASLTRLPLPSQLELCLETIKGRSAEDLVLEMISEILAEGMFPSLELLRTLIDCIASSRTPWSEVRQILRLSVVEYSMKQPWTAERYQALPFFTKQVKEGIMASADEIKEYGDARLCDAKTWVASLYAFWRVLLTLRELFDKDHRLVPTFELCTNLGNLISELPRWLEGLRSHCDGLEDERLVRCLKIFERRLDGLLPSPYIKDLQLRIAPLLESPSGDLGWRSAIDQLQNWFISIWTVSREQLPLHEAITLELGPATKKLLNPRLFETVLLGLEQPLFYVTGCQVDHDLPSSSPKLLTDTGRVHSLASECGKLINTHDWYISFRTGIDPRKHIPDSQLIPQFLRAVHELQLFGFVSPTKKRKDHYERILLFHPVNHK